MAMLRLRPKGSYLMDYCSENLSSDNGEVHFLEGGSITEKIQYFLVKRRVWRLIEEAQRAMLEREVFDFEILVSNLSIIKNDKWDLSLAYCVVKHAAVCLGRKYETPPDRQTNEVLFQYMLLVGNGKIRSIEILKLKLEKMKVECWFDLEFAREVQRRKANPLQDI